MTRELAGLQKDLANVDINSGYATHSQVRNKYQIPDAAGESNLPPTPATNNTQDNEAATSSNQCSPLMDTYKLITLSNAGQNLTGM